VDHPQPVSGPAVARPTDAAVRRVWVWHALFAVSLLIPTASTATNPNVGLGPRTATVAIATAWTALYLAFIQRVEDWDRLRQRDAAGYFVLALGFATILILRDGIYFLVVYALYPQAFLFLGRWRWLGVAAVTGVLAIAAIPRVADDGASAVISVLASAAIATAIGYFIEGVHGESRTRGKALDEMTRMHAATEAVAAARTPEAVAAALRTHLGREGDHVTVAMRPGEGDTGAFVVPLRATRQEVIVIAAARKISDEERRRWQAIGPHVGVVLDNLRLARRSRTTGMLTERERLAREVHDTLAQSLTIIVTQLEAADQALANDPDDVRRRMTTARDAARGGLSAARAFVRDNRPVELADATFTEAIRQVAERWTETVSIPVSISANKGDRAGEVPAAHADTLLRVTQEALANVQRHAAARNVDLTIGHSSGQVTLEIRDDGIGFDPAKLELREDGTGFGLRSMRQRIEGLGGVLTIHTSSGSGTTIRAELPIKNEVTG
jgi:signal transduction histidine kinase